MAHRNVSGAGRASSDNSSWGQNRVTSFEGRGARRGVEYRRRADGGRTRGHRRPGAHRAHHHQEGPPRLGRAPERIRDGRAEGAARRRHADPGLFPDHQRRRDHLQLHDDRQGPVRRAGQAGDDDQDLPPAGQVPVLERRLLGPDGRRHLRRDERAHPHAELADLRRPDVDVRRHERRQGPVRRRLPAGRLLQPDEADRHQPQVPREAEAHHAAEDHGQRPDRQVRRGDHRVAAAASWVGSRSTTGTTSCRPRCSQHGGAGPDDEGLPAVPLRERRDVRHHPGQLLHPRVPLLEGQRRDLPELRQLDVRQHGRLQRLGRHLGAQPRGRRVDGRPQRREPHEAVGQHRPGERAARATSRSATRSAAPTA